MSPSTVRTAGTIAPYSVCFVLDVPGLSIQLTAIPLPCSIVPRIANPNIIASTMTIMPQIIQQGLCLPSVQVLPRRCGSVVSSCGCASICMSEVVLEESLVDDITVEASLICSGDITAALPNCCWMRLRSRARLSNKALNRSAWAVCTTRLAGWIRSCVSTAVFNKIVSSTR